MKGRRIPDGEWHEHEGDERPGDYGLKGGQLHVVLPTGVYGILPAGEWSWVEEDDGTLSVSPSINDVGGYHGWLTHGVWS